MASYYFDIRVVKVGGEFLGGVPAEAVVGAERVAVSDDQGALGRRLQCAASAPEGAFKVRRNGAAEQLAEKVFSAPECHLSG